MTCPKYADSLLAQPLPDGTLLKDYPGPVGAHCIDCPRDCPHTTQPGQFSAFGYALLGRGQEEAKRGINL